VLLPALSAREKIDKAIDLKMDQVPAEIIGSGPGQNQKRRLHDLSREELLSK
jgi:hypothetical protein